MNILAIESSAITASVAILTDECVIAEYTINYKKTHSQTLLPMIDEICRMTDINLENLDLIAVSCGPGSFTGLRIGVATGKGIAFALDKKMISVPTLEAMAYNLYHTEKYVCPIMDARRQHLYCGIYYYKEGKLQTKLEQSLLSYKELVSMLNDINQSVVFVGDGVYVASDYIKDNIMCPYEFAPAHLSTQRASSVGVYAKYLYDKNGALDGAQIVPNYLRPSQAERLFGEKECQK